MLCTVVAQNNTGNNINNIITGNYSKIENWLNIEQKKNQENSKEKC